MAKKPKKSGVPPTSNNTVIHNIADVRAPLMEAAYVRTVNDFTGSIPTQSIVDLLNVGAFSAVDTSIPWRELQEALAEGDVSQELVRGLTQSADAVSAVTARAVKQATGVTPDLTFDSQNAEVRKFINEQVGELITSVTKDSRASVKAIVEQARLQETTVAEASFKIKEVIGLRPDQTRALNNFTARLQEEGKTKKEIRKLSKKFSDQKLKERANMISRTEMMTSVNGGHQVGWEQAADRGYFDPNKAIVRWVTTRQDGRLCPTCESMQDVPRPFKSKWKVTMLTKDVKGNVKKTGKVKMVKIPNRTHPSCRCTMTLDLQTEEEVK